MIAQSAEAIGNVQLVHELDDVVGKNLAGIFEACPADFGAKDLSRFQVTLRTCRRSESVDGRRIKYHRDAVRHEGVIDRVTRHAIVSHQP